MYHKQPLSNAILPILMIAAASFAAAAKTPEIPAGTEIKVRMIDKLSSEQAQVGDTFHATLERPIVVDGKEIYPKGADVLGRVRDVHPSGRLSEPGELDLALVTVSSGGSAASVSVEPLVIKGESHAKSNASKIGGGAALGAIIGAVAGGGKGAAIGAGVGGAAGTGAAAATGTKAATVAPEDVLTFIASTGAVAPAENTPPSAPAPPPADKSSITDENDSTPLFTLRDRRIIRNCVSEHASDFPPGSIDRPELPAGSERQLRRGETLSSEAQKRVLSLPLACEDQLPRLPNDMERVVYSGRVLLIDDNGRIEDMFYLNENQ